MYTFFVSWPNLLETLLFKDFENKEFMFKNVKVKFFNRTIKKLIYNLLSKYLIEISFFTSLMVMIRTCFKRQYDVEFRRYTASEYPNVGEVASREASCQGSKPPSFLITVGNRGYPLPVNPRTSEKSNSKVNVNTTLSESLFFNSPTPGMLSSPEEDIITKPKYEHEGSDELHTSLTSSTTSTSSVYDRSAAKWVSND